MQKNIIKINLPKSRRLNQDIMDNLRKIKPVSIRKTPYLDLHLPRAKTILPKLVDQDIQTKFITSPKTGMGTLELNIKPKVIVRQDRNQTLLTIGKTFGKRKLDQPNEKSRN
jgi:hypothetical protein